MNSVFGEILQQKSNCQGAQWFNAVEAGEIRSLQRIFNRKIGLGKKDDNLDNHLSHIAFSRLLTALSLHPDNDTEGNKRKSIFETAGVSFLSVIRGGDPNLPERNFYLTLAAVSFHLAGFSAVACTLFEEISDSGNESPAEEIIKHLIKRDLHSLRKTARGWLQNSKYSPESFTQRYSSGVSDQDDIYAEILITTVYRALATFDLALECGEQEVAEEAFQLLRWAQELAENVANVPLWWTAALSGDMLSELWNNSLHKKLPQTGMNCGEWYSSLRRGFIAYLWAQKNSEVELWPSQLIPAGEVIGTENNLLISLPTGSGKTRIAEVAILKTLARNKRALIITPLRALSAQTEQSAHKIFGSLGFSVSDFYYSADSAAASAATFKDNDIVIATPEKLDFALRAEPDLIKDVGLVVLDEGHSVGDGERERNYELLVQRLLSRRDAKERRILCLSAVLPAGESLREFNTWIQNGGGSLPKTSEWTPTKQVYGEIVREKDSAKVFCYDAHKSKIELATFSLRAKPFSNDNKNIKLLTYVSAREFISLGKRVLVYCTRRTSALAFAKFVLKKCKKDGCVSAIASPGIAAAVKMGEEYLGCGHPVVECLKLGIAVHYAGLPEFFRRELEKLLSAGELKFIVCSPTLTQGLNLKISVILIPSLNRLKDPIKRAELDNVAGRAGRAYVDTSGYIFFVHSGSKPAFAWKKLLNSERQELSSGLMSLIQKIDVLLKAQKLDTDVLKESRISDLIDGNSKVGELTKYVEDLDRLILGLLGSVDCSTDEIERFLDQALSNSLWKLQCRHLPSENRQDQIIKARAYAIWSKEQSLTRKSCALIGVGLKTYEIFDANLDRLTGELKKAERAAISGSVDEIVAALKEIGNTLLDRVPFKPDRVIPSDWDDILLKWLSGENLENLEEKSRPGFYELISYRLPLALNAIKKLNMFRSESIEAGPAPKDAVNRLELMLETGVPRYPMAILIREGLRSRRAAIEVVNRTQAVFQTPEEMVSWLNSPEVIKYSGLNDWPSEDTANEWKNFRNLKLNAGPYHPYLDFVEKQVNVEALKVAADGVKLPKYVRLECDGKKCLLLTPDYRLVGEIEDPFSGWTVVSAFGKLDNNASILEATALCKSPVSLRFKLESNLKEGYLFDSWY
jgi:superfamily II DNA/RNA helicase